MQLHIIRKDDEQIFRRWEDRVAPTPEKLRALYISKGWIVPAPEEKTS